MTGPKAGGEPVGAAMADSMGSASLSERPPRSVDTRHSSAEPPVVARLVVEIRSDGRTTIARAGVCDDLHRESTMLEARGSTPLSLALSLARHLVELTRPLLSRSRPPLAVRDSTSPNYEDSPSHKPTKETSACR